MKACPNCGRPTARTKDWACQWCGYPLLSGSYKMLPQTYRELKEQTKLEEKPPAPEPALKVEVRREPEPALEVEVEPEPELEPEPVPEVKPKRAPKPRAKVEPAPEPVLEAGAKPEPEPEVEQVAEPVLEAEVEPEVKPPPEPVLEAEPEVESLELNVDQLYSRLEADRAAAEARYKDQVLKVTGLVYRTIINENLTVAYVILASATKHEERQVTCAFDKKHEHGLNRLTEGDTVTVQGTYDSYTATVLLMDCELI